MRDREARRQRARGDRRRDGVGGVVEAVREVERERRRDDDPEDDVRVQLTQVFLIVMPSRMFGDALRRVDRVLEPLEDVLPADHQHRVDPRLEQRGERLAHDPVALVLVAVDLDREVVDVLEAAQPRDRLRRPAGRRGAGSVACCWAWTIGASIRYSAKKSATSSIQSTMSSSAGGERVDVLAVDRRDERLVEALDDVVRDPVALLLADDDVARRARRGRATPSSIRSSRPAARTMFAPASSNRSKNSRSFGANSLDSCTMARECSCDPAVNCERLVYARWRSCSCSLQPLQLLRRDPVRVLRARGTAACGRPPRTRSRPRTISPRTSA